jgi:hypothetical protein
MIIPLILLAAANVIHSFVLDRLIDEVEKLKEEVVRLKGKSHD